MAFWNSIPILGEVVDLIGGELKGWRNRRQARLETDLQIEKAKQTSVIRIAEKSQDHNIEWDMIMAKGSQDSWKDELWTIVFVIPLVMAFVPGLQPYVKMGFENLEQTPDWYLYGVSTLLAAAVGVKKTIGAIKKGRKAAGK